MRLLTFEVVKTTSQLKSENFGSILQFYGGDLPSARSFNMRIKTALCSTVTEDRLNGLAMLRYHRDITVTADEVVEEFVQRQPRRLLMSNPLNE